MSIDRDVIKSVHELNNLVHRNSQQYFHSRPVAKSNSGIIIPGTKMSHGFAVEYDIKDLFTIGALTQSSILMTGGTDMGKTALGKLVMNALFGKEEDGWHRIDVDNDFGKDSYTDVDFGKITRGEKLSDGLYKVSRHFKLPGLMLDEINRSHPGLVNKLLHVFDKDLSLPDGSRVKVGFPLSDGTTYQFQVAAINEGTDYSGTFGIDKAMRRRTILEIPMDIFTPTPEDRLRIQKSGRIGVTLNNEQNNLEKILGIYRNAGSNLKLHPTAELFVSYLESFDFCRFSPTGEKGGVGSKNGSLRDVCTKGVSLGGREISGEEDGMSCQFLKSFENDLCPYVRGISPGISKNLVAVTRGFALLRATKFVEMVHGHLNGEAEKPLSYQLTKLEEFTKSLKLYVGLPISGKELAKAAIEKYFSELEVEIEDVDSALGFVGYSKIGISNQWIDKFYAGNRYEAVKNFSREAREKLEDGLKREELAELTTVLSGARGENVECIRRYCDSQNPWLWRVLTPYLKDQKNNDSASVGELYD